MPPFRWVQAVRGRVREALESPLPKVGCPWHADGTYSAITGRWSYLNRAVDKKGKTVDFLRRKYRAIEASGLPRGRFGAVRVESGYGKFTPQ